MILYLLLPAVFFGIGESQTANMTVEELNEVKGNQTFRESITNNSTMKPGNATSSVYIDEKSLIEDKLQNNQTSFIKEDDENFQDQENEFPGRHCQEDVLENASHYYCGADFHMEMMSISPENWCELENIIGAYNKMTLCLEIVSDSVGCYYPNPTIQSFFISIHSTYFSSCPREEPPHAEDAPQGVVVALTLVPVSLIPVLVYLVVWKKKLNSDSLESL